MSDPIGLWVGTAVRDAEDDDQIRRAFAALPKEEP